MEAKYREELRKLQKKYETNARINISDYSDLLEGMKATENVGCLEKIEVPKNLEDGRGAVVDKPNTIGDKIAGNNKINSIGNNRAGNHSFGRNRGNNNIIGTNIEGNNPIAKKSVANKRVGYDATGNNTTALITTTSAKNVDTKSLPTSGFADNAIIPPDMIVSETVIDPEQNIVIENETAKKLGSESSGKVESGVDRFSGNGNVLAADNPRLQLLNEKYDMLLEDLESER